MTNKPDNDTDDELAAGRIDIIPALPGFYLLYVCPQEPDVIEEQDIMRQPIVAWRIRTDIETDEIDTDPMAPGVKPIIPNPREETNYRAIQYPDGRYAYGLEFFDDLD
jgi:hypothetical protein